jgi:hypothetical protein
LTTPVRRRARKTMPTTRAARLCGFSRNPHFLDAALAHGLQTATTRLTPSGRARYTWFAKDIHQLARQLRQERRDCQKRSGSSSPPQEHSQP